MLLLYSCTKRMCSAPSHIIQQTRIPTVRERDYGTQLFTADKSSSCLFFLYTHNSVQLSIIT